MTRLILAYRRTHDDSLPSFRVIDRFPATIGRGLDCDIILADPYVSAQQAVIRLSESGWEIGDQTVRNPTQVNGRPLAEGAWRPLQSGDHIVLGRSEMTAYAPGHAVAPALPLPREGGLLAVFAHSGLSASLFMLALGISAAFSYLRIWSDEPAMTAALTAAAAFFVMVIWAGLWSVVGRLTVNRARFLMQLGLAAAYIILSLLGSVLLHGADFLLGGNWLAQGLSLIAQMILLSVLTYGSLGIATAFTRKKRLQAAMSFAGGLMLALVSLQAIGGMGFSSEPPFSGSLAPSLARFAAAGSAESFMADAARLFDDPLFDKADSDNLSGEAVSAPQQAPISPSPKGQGGITPVD